MRSSIRKFIFHALFASVIGTTGYSQAPNPVESGRGVPNFLAKIEKDKKAHVVFLGGSITQNAGGHSKMVPAWLKEKWPDVDFTFTNAGLSSTCSVSGAFRLQKDVLAKGPVDLLIVEFAVNDDQDAAHDGKTAIRGLEGIVRQFWKTNPGADIISVQFVNPGILANIQKGNPTVSVEAHKKVAHHYNIPIVDVGLALAAEIKAGQMTWKKDYGGTHPNQLGYKFASGLISQIIENSGANKGVLEVELPEPLDKNSYDGAKAIDPQKLNWLGGWKFDQVSKTLLPLGGIRGDFKKYKALRSDSPGDMLYHTFLGRMLGAFVLAGPDAGMLEISIDGGKWKAVDFYHKHSGGLNYPRSVILADDLSPSYHQVALRVAETKNPKSKGHAVTILYFEVNQ